MAHYTKLKFGCVPHFLRRRGRAKPSVLANRYERVAPLSNFDALPLATGQHENIPCFRTFDGKHGVFDPLPFFVSVYAMRQYEVTFRAQQVQRSSGRSSVAAAAYRTASIMYDERTGLTHDYTRKGGVEHSQIYLPDNAPEHLRNADTQHELRQRLWNAAEEKENRKNSLTAREFIVSFPHEFNAMQRREAGDAVSRQLIERFGCAVEIAYHQPTGDDDKRNFHAHIMYTTRGFDEQSKDGWARTKYRDMNRDSVTTPDGEKTVRSALTIMELKAHAAAEMNRIAERDGLEVQTHHLSFEERGIDREPTQHRGPTADKIEREGKPSDVGDANRKIKASNDNRDALKEQANVISLEHERQKRQGVRGDTPDEIKNDILEAIASKHDHFPYHKKQLTTAQQELEQSRAQLENMTLLQKIAGKRAEYVADIEAKEKNLENARFRINELVNARTRAEIQSGDYQPDVQRDTLGKINAREAAELEAKAAEYQKEQAELAMIEFELSSRSNGDKILGAITGKTREQKARIDELRESVKAYEAKRRQYEVYTATQSREEAEFQQQKHKQDAARDQAERAQRMAENRIISDEFDEEVIHKYDRAPDALAEQNRLRDEEADYKERHKHDYDEPQGEIAKEDHAAAERVESAKEEIAEHVRERTIEPDGQEIDRKPDELQRE